MAYSRNAIRASLQAAIEKWLASEADDPPWDAYVPPELAARMADAAAQVVFVLEDTERFNKAEGHFV